MRNKLMKRLQREAGEMGRGMVSDHRNRAVNREGGRHQPFQIAIYQ